MLVKTINIKRRLVYFLFSPPPSPAASQKKTFLSYSHRPNGAGSPACWRRQTPRTCSMPSPRFIPAFPQVHFSCHKKTAPFPRHHHPPLTTHFFGHFPGKPSLAKTKSVSPSYAIKHGTFPRHTTALISGVTEEPTTSEKAFLCEQFVCIL